MDKQGYTLIELIVVILIVSVIGLYGVISLNKTLNESKNQKYNEMIQNIKDAANTYFTIYSEYDEYSNLRTELYSKKTLKITIEELQNKLLLDEDLKNPKDNSTVSGCVILTYNTAVTYNVCPYEGCKCE